ncbi:MAG: acetylpolyamine amidohydrolase [Thermoplasmata archaeon]|nr:acetylpolyamine amidohydrolase [Thermoplasmata archaeon]
MAKFNFGQGHPFNLERFAWFMNLLEKAGLSDRLEKHSLVPATVDDLKLVHSDTYLAYIDHLKNINGRLTMDTPVNSNVTEVQSLIVGSGLQAAQLVLDKGGAAHTFGGLHHAGPDYGEGFCLYNDVAVTAKALVERHGQKKIMVFDTDAHQGNGTMDIFYDDPRVLFISIHQDPRTLYPGRGFVHEIGSGEGTGYTVNIPIPPYSSNSQYERALDEIFTPLVKEFEPDVIIRNGGSDPYHGDDLTILGLDYDGLNMVGRKVREAALDGPGACDKQIDMMVSGYGDLVIYGWLALFCGIEGLDDIDYKKLAPTEYRRPGGYTQEKLDDITEEMLVALKKELEEYWNCF